MSKAILAVLAIVCASVLYSAANPKPAYCATCLSAMCLTAAQCNPGCKCLRMDDFNPGTCVSLQ